MFFAVASGGLVSPEKGDLIVSKSKMRNNRKKKPETEQDARRKMITIRLINSSSASVSNPNMKKNMVGDLWVFIESPGESNVRGVSISQEGGVGRWVGGG